MAVLDFPGDMVPLDKDQQGKLRKDLHPAQLLLVCLNDICPRGPPPKPSDPPPNLYQSPEEMFHTLVNKLAQILDFEPKGDTITAMAVILFEGKVTYVFASNQRGPNAMKNARKGLEDVLNILKANLEAPSKEPDHVIEQRLMDKVLWWNKVRVRSYLTALSIELEKCMPRCDISTPDGKAARGALGDLAKTLPDLKMGGQKTETYIEATVKCIKAIQANRNSPLQKFISARSAEDHNMGKGGSWSNLQHAAGRLLSYQYAVEVIVHAHHMWADTELFRDFNIESLRSSTPYPADTNLFNETPETAELVLNRCPGSGEHKKQLKKDAADLEKYQLETTFQRRWTKHAEDEKTKGDKRFRRIVHAEVLLHSWLLATEGGVRSPRFFQNWQYIGTSKPLCRMCTEYFTHVISTPVQFRPSHPNTYLNFRLPDLYVNGRQNGKEQREKEARQRWCVDLGRFRERVYASVARVLGEKVAEWKRFDSNTYTDRVDVTSLTGDVGFLAGWFGGLQVGER